LTDEPADHGYGMITGALFCSLSVLDPVEVPHWAQKYSYRLPVGRTRSNRSRAGVAWRHFGQNSNDARSAPNCDSGSGRCRGARLPIARAHDFL